MLARISGFAVRRPLVVIVLWLAVVGAGFAVGIGVFDRLVADVGVVPGSESTARRDAAATTPRPSRRRMTAVVSGRPATDPAVRASVAAAVADLRAMPGRRRGVRAAAVHRDRPGAAGRGHAGAR